MCVAGKIRCVADVEPNFTDGKEYPIVAVDGINATTINDLGVPATVQVPGDHFEYTELYIPVKVV